MPKELENNGFRLGQHVTVLIPQEKKSHSGIITGFTNLGVYVCSKDNYRGVLGAAHLPSEWFSFSACRVTAN